jgi:hypothetical protein
LIIETLRRELASLYIPPPLDPNNPKQAYPGTGSDGFIFHTLNPSWKTADPAARIAKITYKFTPNPQTGRGLLIRSEQLFATETQIAPPITDIISEYLSAFTVTLVNDPNEPPKAIDVSLVWQDRTLQTRIPVSVQTSIDQ